jgi:hypothetical protein
MNSVGGKVAPISMSNQPFIPILDAFDIPIGISIAIYTNITTIRYSGANSVAIAIAGVTSSIRQIITPYTAPFVTLSFISMVVHLFT